MGKIHARDMEDKTTPMPVLRVTSRISDKNVLLQSPAGQGSLATSEVGEEQHYAHVLSVSPTMGLRFSPVEEVQGSPGTRKRINVRSDQTRNI